ncbi:peptide chain release factor 1 [Neocucurbitaria cava]|uniref:Peptide chain release factor 1 n=1 Tax=Neocucurbitaria cava TaxID=798079 RepID=A0A9W8Y2B2_9PLEO|nr:peptide chain release factor 1 [Neocucurbitaria cava]
MASVAKAGNSKDAPTNPRGIPQAPFVDRVEDYVTDRSEVESTINSFKEMISYASLPSSANLRKSNIRPHSIPQLTSFLSPRRKYQFMQQNTQRRASGLKDKIPDIQKTLETVRFLQSRSSTSSSSSTPEPLETTFELNDTLYARASVPISDEVYLWLGANVMLSYPIPEAEELLRGKLDTARSSLATCEEDLDFLREQITTLEVAFARVYNWDVAMRRKEREDGGGEGVRRGRRGEVGGK